MKISGRNSVATRRVTAGRCTWIILALALMPSTASANAGTPLMWATMIHLAVGNAFIGLIEGLLVSRIFGSPVRRSIWSLIAANYASAWADAFLFPLLRRSVPDINIENVKIWLCGFGVVAFLVTLLIEFGFYWFVMRPQKCGLLRVAWATVVVNVMSYVLLVGWYGMVSSTSMITRLQVVSPGSQTPSGEYALFFISADGSKVLQADLNGGNSGVLGVVEATHRNDRLFARSNGKNGHDLLLHLESDDGRNTSEVLIAENFSWNASDEAGASSQDQGESRGTHFNFGEVPSLAVKSDWEFRTGFWAAEGLSGTNRHRRESVRFSLETPFVSWGVRNATQLEGDFILFQLGEDQICMMHPESGRIALVARGKGPIVALKDGK